MEERGLYVIAVLFSQFEAVYKAWWADIADLALVVISYEIYETSLWQVS